MKEAKTKSKDELLPAVLTSGMPYNEPARTVARRTRSTILAALVVVSATLIGVVSYESVGPSLASSSFSAASPSDIPHGDHRRARGQRGRDHQHRTSTPTSSSPPTTLGEADGAVPGRLTVFDDENPAVANLDPDLLGALRQAATDAAEDGVEIFVNSGWRSPEYQEQLLHEAVSKYGSEEDAARWVATADTSSHVSGDAVDIGPSDATAWLSKHGAEYRLCQVYSNEPWHYELRPEAIDDSCPSMYADPTHDPRMQFSRHIAAVALGQSRHVGRGVSRGMRRSVPGRAALDVHHARPASTRRRRSPAAASTGSNSPAARQSGNTMPPRP